MLNLELVSTSTAGQTFFWIDGHRTDTETEIFTLGKEGGFVWAGALGFFAEYQPDQGFCAPRFSTSVPVRHIAPLGDQLVLTGNGADAGTPVAIIGRAGG